MFGGVLDLDVFRDRRRFRDGQMIFAKTADVKVNGFGHMGLRIPGGITGRDATRQIRRIRRIVGAGVFDYDEIFVHYYLFRPACLRMLFIVPGARS